MSLTEVGHRLSVQHRATQGQVRAQFLSRMVALWPVWRVDDPASFGALVEAMLPLMNRMHGVSAEASIRYYNAYRLVEAVQGPPPTAGPATFSREAAEASSYVTGQRQAQRSLSAGLPVEQVRANTLSTLAGSAARHVAEGGRNTMLGAIYEDGQSFGWERMTGTRPCAFCAMLASRGAVYKSRESAEMVGYGSENVRRGFPAQYGRIRGTRSRGDSFHDNCDCYAEPRFVGDPLLSDENRPYRELWYETTQDTPQQLLEFRRAYEGRAAPTDARQAVRALGPTPTRQRIEESLDAVRTITAEDVPRLVERQVTWAQSVGWEVEPAGRIITGTRNVNRPGISGIQWELTDRGTWRVIRSEGFGRR